MPHENIKPGTVHDTVAPFGPLLESDAVFRNAESALRAAAGFGEDVRDGETSARYAISSLFDSIDFTTAYRGYAIEYTARIFQDEFLELGPLIVDFEGL